MGDPAGVRQPRGGAPARDPLAGSSDVDAVLDRVMDRMCTGFDPARTLGEEGVFHYEVITPEGLRHRYVTVAGGRCAVSATATGPATATITIDLVDLLRIALGELSGSEVFHSGRLHISGDIYFSMNWRDWFGGS